MQRNFSFFNGFIGLSKAMRMRNVVVKDFHASSIASQSGGEKRIEDLLKSKLKINEMVVRDISGGCGSMYEIFIVSDDFKGKRTVQQHRLINEILKEEVKQMHGLRIHTRIPE